jgi:hypothetical protein
LRSDDHHTGRGAGKLAEIGGYGFRARDDRRTCGDPRRHRAARLQRRFLSTSGHILNHGNQIIVRLDRRTYSPVLRQADLPAITVPWLGARTVRYEFA